MNYNKQFSHHYSNYSLPINFMKKLKSKGLKPSHKAYPYLLGVWRWVLNNEYITAKQKHYVEDTCRRFRWDIASEIEEI